MSRPTGSGDRAGGSDEADLELITEYLAGLCSETDVAAVRARLETDARFKLLVSPIIEEWNATGGAEDDATNGDATVGLPSGPTIGNGRAVEDDFMDEATLQAAWRRVRERILSIRPSDAARLPFVLPLTERVEGPRQPPTWSERLAGFIVEYQRGLLIGLRALGVAGTVAVGVFLVLHYFGHLIFGRPEVEKREYTSPKGATTVLRLADETRVFLASGTTLRSSQHPTEDTPFDMLVVDGEVAIEPRAHPASEIVEASLASAAPSLTVRARNATVRALDGNTTFGVRAYEDERAVRVVVTAGRVEIRLADGVDSSIVVSEGQETSVTDGISPPRRTRFTLAWRNGTHVYQAAPLGDVMQDLTHWYGVGTFLSPADLATSLVTVEFAGTAVDPAVGALGKATGLLVTYNGKRVVGQVPR